MRCPNLKSFGGFALIAQEISRLSERRSTLVALDTGAVVLSATAAYLLETVRGFPPRHLLVEGQYVAFMLAMRMPALALAGVYRSIWRYGSVSDVLRVVKGVGLGTVAAAGGLIWLEKLRTIGPILTLDTLLVLCAIMALRLAAKLGAKSPSGSPPKRTLIVGAGDAGEMIARQMLARRGEGYHPVGFLDDDPAKRGKTIHGVPVLGACGDAKRIAAETAAAVIVIAAPSANSRQMRSIVDKCSSARLPIKTVPAIKDILDGKVKVSHIREVNVEDLVDRKPATHDSEAIQTYIRGKRVLVTGAAGSIGSELCRMVLRYGPSTLVAMDISENGLFYLKEDLAEATRHCRFAAVVANTQCRTAVDKVLQKYRPQVVFHAAAHKHVPLMEENLEEAVKNNVRGAMNVALACERAGVEEMVNISTDKAVKPTSVMGATKRLVEMFVSDLSNRSRTRFCTVRFGNVLGSSGSVVPLFRRQIEKGGPVTVTHPSIRRYFMTLSEAVSLVLQAASMCSGGEVFVLDMGEQVKISDLAEHLIRLSGLEPHKDVEVKYTGLRPGEKMHEELWEPGESPRPTNHPKILVARPSGAPEHFHPQLRLLLHYADIMDRARVMALMTALVPGYRPQTPVLGVPPSELPDIRAGSSALEELCATSLARNPGAAFPPPAESRSLRLHRSQRRSTLSTAIGRRV